METCLTLARKHGVHVGAHPGAWNHGNFGRAPVETTPHELELLLVQQVGGFALLAAKHRAPLHHIKLHGALYHAVESSPLLARRYIIAVKRYWPSARIYARAGGLVSRLARKGSVDVWEEAFADRNYDDAGGLLPRSHPNALVTDRKEIVQRVQSLVRERRMTSFSGKRFALHAQTICIHSDTPQALSIAQAVQKTLGEIVKAP